jgi:hypothetical protein
MAAGPLSQAVRHILKSTLFALAGTAMLVKSKQQRSTDMTFCFVAITKKKINNTHKHRVDLASSARKGAGFPWGDARGSLTIRTLLCSLELYYPNITII